jgi:hypothetical protein
MVAGSTGPGLLRMLGEQIATFRTIHGVAGHEPNRRVDETEGGENNSVAEQVRAHLEHRLALPGHVDDQLRFVATTYDEPFVPAEHAAAVPELQFLALPKPWIRSPTPRLGSRLRDRCCSWCGTFDDRKSDNPLYLVKRVAHH